MSGPSSLRCRIRAEAGEPARIDVYDEIGSSPWGGGISAADFAGQLAGVSGPVRVHVNSGGGDAFEGMAIYNALAARGGVTTVVDGLAASIASVIVQAGERRVMQPGSVVMIHDAHAAAAGDEAELQKLAGALGKVSDSIAQVYARRAGGSAAYWRGQMRAETWFTADDAVSAGLADEVGGSAAQMPASAAVLAARAPYRIAAQLRRPAADPGLLEHVREQAYWECVRQQFLAVAEGRRR